RRRRGAHPRRPGRLPFLREHRTPHTLRARAHHVRPPVLAPRQTLINWPTSPCWALTTAPPGTGCYAFTAARALGGLGGGIGPSGMRGAPFDPEQLRRRSSIQTTSPVRTKPAREG